MYKLISEIIELPDRVRKGDFVLNLSKGVTEPEKTLAQYVVTPQLVACFNDALSFIRSAVEAANSKACYPSGRDFMIEVRPLFQLRANVDPPQVIDGPLGQRWFIPVTGGSLCGDRISGVAQAGGSDFQLIRKDGVAELDVRVTLLTDDGVTIQLKGHGIRHTTPEVLQRIMSGAEVDPTEYYFREALFFEAPVGKYDWLNRIIAIAKGGRLKSHVLIDAYEVL